MSADPGIDVHIAAARRSVRGEASHEVPALVVAALPIHGEGRIALRFEGVPDDFATLNIGGALGTVGSFVVGVPTNG